MREPPPETSSAQTDRPRIADAFVAALARTAPRTRRWYCYQAGLLVLERIEHACVPAHARAADAQQMEAARQAVAEVRPAATRAALSTVLDDLASGGPPRREALAALDTYAARLEREGELALACAVYRTLIDSARDTGQADLLPHAYHRFGSNLRDLSDETGAMAAYQAGVHAASQQSDDVAIARLSIAQAHLHRSHGRIAEARTILDATLSAIKTLGLSDLVARASHERGVVAHRQSEYPDALRYYREALGAYVDRDDRARLLIDIGRSLRDLGYAQPARDAFLVAHLTSGVRMVRWMAAINLIAVAVQLNDEPAFEQFREAVRRAPMPARLLGHYLLEVGDGCTRFGRLDEARIAYRRAASVAERFDLPEVRRLAQQGFAQPLAPHDGQRGSGDPAVSPEIRALIDELNDMRSVPSLLGRRPPGLRTSLRRGRRPRRDIE